MTDSGSGRPAMRLTARSGAPEEAHSDRDVRGILQDVAGCVRRVIDQPTIAAVSATSLGGGT